MNKEEVYEKILTTVDALIAEEEDLIAVMSTVSCEVFQEFEAFNWVGFYRKVDDRTLKVGPYQGSHGCLTIDQDRGVCGACFKTGQTQLENDVSKAASHIACSSLTKSELVLPVFSQSGEVKAVLDIDSTELGVFDETDVEFLEKICVWVGERYR